MGEGYLTKRQGRGTFVTATMIIRKVHQKDDVQSFTQACAENGMKAGARVVARKTVAADRDLASFFGLDEGSDLILVSRVRTADGVPVLFENNYYPVDGFEFLKDIGLSNCSIFEAVGERTVVSLLVRSLQAGDRPCGIDAARELKVPVGEPLFFMNAGFLDSMESASAMADSTTWVRATASISRLCLTQRCSRIAAAGPFSA
ncbi:MAG: GntR family transcriptional regulator [Collinsella sp.]